MKFDHVKVCQSKGITEWLTPDRAENLRYLLSMFEQDPDMTDLRWIAYGLATVLRECGPALKCVAEYPMSSDPRFLRYETGALGKMLGNTRPQDGMTFRGRGFVQITGRANYEKFERELRMSLVSQPGLALQPGIAYRILSIGMRRGLFTGKKLGDYINSQFCDYRSARRIINGLDHAEEITNSARTFEKALMNAKMD